MIWDDFRELFGIVRRKLPGSPLAFEDRLRSMCGGDPAAANRLIDYELTREPDLNRRQACVRAIERLERDR